MRHLLVHIELVWTASSRVFCCHFFLIENGRRQRQDFPHREADVIR